MKKKRKLGRKLLSFLLTLAMVVGLMPGMGLTAYAATDTYTNLIPTGSETNVTGKLVLLDFAEYPYWYVIKDNSTAVDNGTITLLAYNPIGASEFHGSNNSYSGSTVETYLKELTASESQFASLAEVIVPTDLSDVNVTDAKLFLLSADEASALPENVRKCSQAEGASGHYWWLRSKGTYSGKHVAGVSGSHGIVYANAGEANEKYGIRPAFQLDLSKVEYHEDWGNVFMLAQSTPAVHMHDFTYSADGAAISAECSNLDGNCTLTQNKVALTISANNAVYDGNTHGATLDSAAWTAAGLTAPTIQYTGRDSTTYNSETEPTNAGKYTASITVEEKIASVNYEIAKADPTAPTDLTATCGQTLADVALPTGWTWADSTQSVGNVVSPAATFKAKFAGDDNYNAASNVDVAVTVNKAANPTKVTNTATVTKGGSTVDLASNVTLNGATGDVTYAINGEANGCTLSGSTLTSGDNTGSVTVNVSVAEDNNYNALAATPITVTISDKGTQNITASNVTATYGDTDKKVEATTDGNGTISYAVKDGSADYIDVNTSTGALTIKKAGTATVIVTAAETATYAQATKEVTVTINKADAVAATVTANNRTYDGTDKPLVNVDNSTLVGGEMWYALGENATTAPADKLYTTSIPTKTDAGTYYVWYKVVGDKNHLDTQAQSVAVTVEPVLFGDVNFDGIVDIADALMISRYDAELAELNEKQLFAGDVDGDGEVNIADALMISRYDAGLLDKFTRTE